MQGYINTQALTIPAGAFFAPLLAELKENLHDPMSLTEYVEMFTGESAIAFPEKSIIVIFYNSLPMLSWHLKWAGDSAPVPRAHILLLAALPDKPYG